jgi:ABC-type sugar transport system permease subunit/uncharacterized protein YgiM (DUF1202 family)
MWIVTDNLTLEMALERLVDLLPLLVISLVGIVILEVSVYFFFSKVLKSKYALPYTLVAPAAVALLLFTVYPFAYNIRLAFSDLRLKTFSCYIPDNTITNTECSLARAAPNTTVELDVDELPARHDRSTNAEVVFTVEKGDELYVTGRELKISDYIQTPGNPVEVSEDGTSLNLADSCAVPPFGNECIARFNEFKDTVLAMQDERDWWPVRNEDGETGWIPATVTYATADSPLYVSDTGPETVDSRSVSEGEEIRVAAAPPLPTQWYEIRLDDDQTGWVDAEYVLTNLSFFPETEASVYADTSQDSEVIGNLEAGGEYELRQQLVLTWYQLLVENVDAEENVIGWVNAPAKNPSTITVFTASTDANLYDEDVDLQDIEAATPIGQIGVGDKLTQVARDETTADDIWYKVITQDGTVGWTNTIPLESDEIEVLTFASELPLYDDIGSSEPIGTLPANTQARLVDRSTSQDQTWYQVRAAESGFGWTAVPGTIQRNFFIDDDADVEGETVPVYAEIGAMGEVNAAIGKGEPITVVNPEPAKFTRYRVALVDDTGAMLRDDEGKLLIGWVTEQPETEITTEREVVLYSLDYGWKNFKRVFVKEDRETGEIEGWGRLLQTKNSTFPRLMRTTVLWTSLNVIFHLLFGMLLALLLNRPSLKLRGVYRAIIVLPWAISQPIIALAWKGEFHSQFGFVNHMLTEIGLEPVNWLFSPTPAFIAVTFVNIWLGIPFYMVTLLGGLQSIDGSYYEAAEIDGANAWNRFLHVTVPLIRPVAVPIITLDVVWTFNNFNVIYLITRGDPNESTNILVTALYNAAFGRNGQTQLGFAAAFSLVIFAVLFLFAVVWVTSSGALKGVYED